MNNRLEQDLNQIEQLLEEVRTESSRFLASVNERPVSTEFVRPDLYQLPSEGPGASDALKQFIQRYDKAIVSSTGPRYWGFVTGGSTPASILGDWLATVYDQNTQTVKGQGDISAVIEKEAINLLLDLFDLPATFQGGFVTGATMSNFTCLGTARQWLGKQLGIDIARDGVSGEINVLSGTPHSSALKSLAMLGIGSNRFIRISTIEGNREAVDINELKRAIGKLNGAPFILISSAATVNTSDFDDFNAIAGLKKEHSFWWHIDAAFGGFAALSSTHRHLLDKWEEADSITVDCHKWLNVPYENAVYFIKEQYSRFQVETFQNSNAPYLGDPLANFNYLNFLPENSRRLRALPVWFTLMAYGKQGHAAIVENSIRMTNEFGNYIQDHDQLTLLAPVRLNTVCFSLKNDALQDKVNDLLFHINASQQVFMTPTVYKNKKGIRAAFVNWRTGAEDIRMAVEVIEEALKRI